VERDSYAQRLDVNVPTPKTCREQLAPLRQDVDDVLCRLVEGTVQQEEVAAWAGERMNEQMPIDGHKWNADPRLWETLALMLELGPPWSVEAPPTQVKKVLKRFRTPEPKRVRRKGAGGK